MSKFWLAICFTATLVAVPFASLARAQKVVAEKPSWLDLADAEEIVHVWLGTTEEAEVHARMINLAEASTWRVAEATPVVGLHPGGSLVEFDFTGSPWVGEATFFFSAIGEGQPQFGAIGLRQPTHLDLLLQSPAQRVIAVLILPGGAVGIAEAFAAGSSSPVRITGSWSLPFANFVEGQYIQIRAGGAGLRFFQSGIEIDPTTEEIYRPPFGVTLMVTPEDKVFAPGKLTRGKLLTACTRALPARCSSWFLQ